MNMMFSGIVEDIGVVEKLTINKQMPMWDGSVGEGVELTVQSSRAVEEAYVGCSIAVNGVCLTATEYDTSKFTVGLAPETLRRSNLGKLEVGSKVNVERALRADGRNSGHFVQGHVDGTGSILDRWEEGDSLWVKVQVPLGLLKYIVPKGFIAIDGTSLTVCEVHQPDSKEIAQKYASQEEAEVHALGWFTIMLVSHTQQNVIFPTKFVGDTVNIEVDVLGKMVEQSLSGSMLTLKGSVEALRDANFQRDADIKEMTASLQSLETRLAALERKLQQ
eukprot:CAMPEP_0174981350 /NCGR_PEP_ID=MMETSP0004_2-20121128/15840_1 /TAXON_ID=420556 /ORGANISM="Ochromonas sp., Strain CCMP1393" /LENGTH=275 /DNA_ID=CAMNT_0016233083 /DNA_START=149 /DNA_END=976 /DNA_ORIENTATION=-